ncbi:MAG: hypothetical protein ACLFT6_07170, partial [Bacteroidales bacterium]
KEELKMREKDIDFNEEEDFLYNLSNIAKEKNMTFTYGEINEMLAKFNKSAEMKMIRNAISMDTAIHLEFETDKFSAAYTKQEIHLSDEAGNAYTEIEKELYVIDSTFGDILIENINGVFHISIIRLYENRIGGLIAIVANAWAEKFLSKFERIVYAVNNKIAIAGRHRAGSLSGWLTIDKNENGLEFLEPYEMAKLVMEHEIIEIQAGLHALKK